jgi:hypothetical protein
MATITGMSTITFGRMFQSEKNKGEGNDAFEKRCWRERMHVDDDGYVLLQPGSVKLAMEIAAKLRSDSIPGKGKQTFTKNIRGGIITDPSISSRIMVPVRSGEKPEFSGIKAIDVVGRTINVPSDGRRGGTKRVPRTFPEIDAPWRVDVGFIVFDEDLIEHNEKLHEYLELAGWQVGIGVHRPETSGGDHGMFTVDDHMFEVIS